MPLAVALGERLHAEPDHGDPRGREHRHRGRLPARADAMTDVREAVPERRLRDHRRLGASDVRRQAARTSRVSPTRRRRRGCLVGVLAAKMAKKQGGKQMIGAVGGIKIPPVDSTSPATSSARRRPCRARRSSFGYSNDFVAPGQVQDGRAERDRPGRRRSIFQVAGGCGLGALKAADEARYLGHRRRRRPVQRREARPHERGEERRRRRLRRDPAGEAGKFTGRHGPALQPEEQGRRASARSTRPCRRRGSR